MLNDYRSGGPAATARDHLAALAAGCAITRIVWLVTLLWLLPASAQGQDFTYTVNNGAVTITGYTGPGGEVFIPDIIAGLPVKVIGPYSFSQSSLTSVTIPDGVTSIGSSAFLRCTRLPSVLIPDSVTTIGVFAFDNCRQLGRVTIGSGVTTIGDRAFSYCGLTNVTIGDAVTQIGYAAFLFCLSLTNVSIPDSVTIIGQHGFDTCVSLKSVTIPDSVTTIGSSAFHLCTSLTNVTIGNGVTELGSLSFDQCSSLASAYFKGNAPGIGTAVFLQTGNSIIYHLPGTSGWGSTFGGWPTALWLPRLQSSRGDFGVKDDLFSFDISWASDQTVVVEAATTLSNPDWSPVSTNTLTGGSSPFSDPQWVNHPARFYRLRSP